jgi:hypothetical protein
MSTAINAYHRVSMTFLEVGQVSLGGGKMHWLFVSTDACGKEIDI